MEPNWKIRFSLRHKSEFKWLLLTTKLVFSSQLFGVLLLTILLVARAKKDYTEKNKKIKMSKLLHCLCRRKGLSVNESQASSIFPHLPVFQCCIFYLKFDSLVPFYSESFLSEGITAQNRK